MSGRTSATLPSGQNPDIAPHVPSRKAAFVLGASLLALGACTEPGETPRLSSQAGQNTAYGAASAAAAASGPRLGVLLPLSGSDARLGAEMLAGARLALASPGSPVIDARDTAAPGGAFAAAEAALQAGDRMLLGPLRGSDTSQIAPLARSAGVPVLSFTSDSRVASPGLWVMGITPEHQVLELVQAAKAEGRQHFAAFLPDNAMGHALSDGLIAACAQEGLPSPTIAFHSSTSGSIASGLKTLADYDARLARATPAAGPAAVASVTGASVPVASPPAAPALPQAASPTTQGLPPLAGSSVAGQSLQAPKPQPAPVLDAPPFDALLLGDTGLELAQVITNLQADQVNTRQVRIMGPMLWAAFASKLGGLKGAWYAAPDPQARVSFVQRFIAVNHHAPTPLADLAYDSAALARATSRDGGFDASALVKPNGFAGVDGVFHPMPDGHVRRSLALFEIQPGGGSSIRRSSGQGA